MYKAVIGAVATVTLLAVAAFVALAYPFIYRDPLADPYFEIDDGEEKARLDSQIVIELRGSFPEEEIRESLNIDPPVLIGEDDLAVEHIARFPWHEGFSWAKTRVTINPRKSRLFEPETTYAVALKDKHLTLETISLPRVATARVDSPLLIDFKSVPTSSPIVLGFNKKVIWQDEHLEVEPSAEVTTTTQESSEGGTELWVIPRERWENSTTYTLTIKEGVRDISGHEGAHEFSLDFTTWGRPTVVGVAPSGENLPVNSAVRVEFERAVDRQTVEEAFRFEPPTPGSFEWDNDLVLNWKPSALEYSTTYTVSVGGMAIGGDPIVQSEWTFTTMSQPRVVDAQPIGSSLPLGSVVTIEFDREADRETVQEAFRIEPGVAGSFNWENDRVVTWKPDKLEYSTTYALSAGGRSIDGDPIVPHEWAFTTHDPPVFVEIEGSDHSPTLLHAVASGGIGEYSYKWNSGETSDEISVDLWYGETWDFEVRVSSGDRTATASLLVIGPPSPCPKGWDVITVELCYKEEVLPGPVRVFLARVDLLDSDLQLHAAPAADFLGLASTVSKSARARHTLVSINGDFFDLSKGEYFTLGPIVSGGNFAYAPGSAQVVLALDQDLKSWVGRGDEFRVYLQPPAGQPRRLQLINRAPASNSLALFNAYWGRDLSLDVNGCYGVFAPADTATSTAYQSSCGAIKNIPLRVGEFVLVGTGQAAEWIKQNIKQPLTFSTSFPMPGVDFIVGGSHVLIRDGELSELNSLLSGRHPRTAIGIDDEGFVYFAVVDGRSSASVGMTLVELQHYLSRLGLVNAINLDGGGSSTMVLQQSVMNSPSDGRERSVAAVVEVTEQRGTCWHGFIRC
ncbi:MAG: hypothetical protein GTO63_22730 [Anaerolineae bacterium]|nr:hypothetical protein [Anaerolineae bacterium]NIN97590.1 hypothetical protein [Anaerolineae bacterium]NIO70372.1 hypothetical protein [Anaerolineae bacterium]NIQ80535.1 hypothetical protein [Anaerolineae bacterium]